LKFDKGDKNMKIEILGSGCAKCNKTKKFVEEAVAQAGVDAEIVKVENMDDIIAYGVLITPAVVVDGEVKIVGRVPKVDEVLEWIKN
jgi:small redox-active disulfide protein 2